MRYQRRLCIFKEDELRARIPEKVHGSCYSIHPSSTKMYNDFSEVYWWKVLKKDIAKFVAKGQNFQQVKAKHQKLSVLL